MKKLRYAATIGIILILLGLFVPLGSYTTSAGCQLTKTPTARLHFIQGDTLDAVKNTKYPVGAGCAVNTKYVLYFL
jgi:hypothetical protein